MLKQELLTTPFTLEYIAEQSAAAEAQNRRMAKVGTAALVLDPYDQVLVCFHEGVDGEFAQFAMGPLMETMRYVEDPAETRIETPTEAFQRALLEELAVDHSKFIDAGLYFDREQPITIGEWSVGPADGYNDKYFLAANMIIRTANPRALTSSERLSEECLGTTFMPIDEVLAMPENIPRRPGFTSWLTDMRPRIHEPTTGLVVPLDWRQPIVASEDVRFPFRAAAA